MAHALARGVFGFGLARFGLGLGEAGNFPAAVKTVTEWFPIRERAFATGLFNSGSNVGAVLAPLCVPWLTLHYGWQMAFIIPGVICLVCAVAFVMLVPREEMAPAKRAPKMNDLPPAVMEQFRARFPAPGAELDLECWDRFEADHPDTFAAMYQLWCRPR